MDKYEALALWFDVFGYVWNGDLWCCDNVNESMEEKKKKSVTTLFIQLLRVCVCVCVRMLNFRISDSLLSLFNPLFLFTHTHAQEKHKDPCSLFAHTHTPSQEPAQLKQEVQERRETDSPMSRCSC